ncbi:MULTISPECIES: hypothetical protein [unclassified Streptomyces]|uniref:hypothetical protein n=1 Tax=unclassified Streptomyces TaxID=2593676 RepID=UPI0037F2E7EA
MSARPQGTASETQDTADPGAYRAPDGIRVPITATVPAVRAGTRTRGPGRQVQP